MFKGRMFLSLFKMPMFLNIVFEILSTWLFQFKCWLIVSPRKLKSDTYSIIVSSIYIWNGVMFLCALWKIINVVLKMFKDNLCNLKQSVMVNKIIINTVLNTHVFLEIYFKCGCQRSIISINVKTNILLAWAISLI